VTKRQRKDLETSWKKERSDLQKQLQQSQQSLKDMQKQITTREAPSHLTEKINILITENELLLNKIKELENVVGDVQLLKTEMQRLREKNSSDWGYWRKQQSDLYAQLRQQQFIKESILNKFDRLQKQVMKKQIISIQTLLLCRSNPAIVILVLVLYRSIVSIMNQTLKQVYRILAIILNFNKNLLKIQHYYPYRRMIKINKRCLRKLIQPKKIQRLVLKKYFPKFEFK